MEIWHSIVLGIIEGITEFLPVSSTAHLIIVSKLLSIPETEIVKSFDIAIQLGAILAIIVLYPSRLLRDKATILRITAAFIPTAILGATLYPYIKHHLLDATFAILVALFLGGIFLIWFERNLPTGTKTINELSLGKTALIGLMQAVAFLPGVSRSGASIVGSMYLGLTRKEAVEFSFLLAVPTMLAATLLDLYKSKEVLLDAPITPFIVGFVVAFTVALIVVKYFVRMLDRFGFTMFGIYRILIALILYIIFF